MPRNRTLCQAMHDNHAARCGIFAHPGVDFNFECMIEAPGVTVLKFARAGTQFVDMEMTIDYERVSSQTYESFVSAFARHACKYCVNVQRLTDIIVTDLQQTRWTSTGRANVDASSA